MKTIVLVRARGEGLGDWLLSDLAARPWAQDASRIVVQLASPGQEPPLPCDAVIELWSAAPLAEALAADAELAARAMLDIRTSDEVVAKNERGTPAVGLAPGLSQLSFIAGIEGMTPAERLRHWAEHIPLALDIHVGMNSYVQDRLSPAAAGAPPWFGMAHLHFPDAEALHTGLFRSQADIDAITADVAEFVGGYATVLAVEHVLKA